MTGMGLAQIALISGVIALVVSGVGAWMAGNQRDPSIEANLDALGVGIVSALTAPEPSVWKSRAGTFKEARRRVKAAYPDNFEWPAMNQETRDRLLTEDAKLEKRTKTGLQQIAGKNPDLTSGVLRGMMINFRGSKYGTDQRVGALINAQTFSPDRKITGEVSVAHMTANDPLGGAFRARVYYRPYRNLSGTQVGGAYAILSAARVDSSGAGGGGMWVYITPLLVLAACGLMIFQANQAGQGAISLARELDSIGRGRLDTRVAVTAGGEVGLAQRQADRMGKNLQLIISTGSGDLDEALEKELELANQIHGSLRPSEPPRVPGYELETLFKGGREIGGDYFDYIELDERRIALVLADCTESLRGVAAAMIMAMTRAYLKSSIEPSEGPSEWLKATNRRLANDLKSGMAVTAIVALLDTQSGEVTLASAGHHPAILWRAGKTASLNPNGIALGLDIGPVFDRTIEEKRITMQKNDRLVLYTDGVMSAVNDGGEAYGEARLMESVRKQGAMNSAAFVNFVAGGVDKFLSGEEQDDDITISTLKRMK
jgi:hypothetical protein